MRGPETIGRTRTFSDILGHFPQEDLTHPATVETIVEMFGQSGKLWEIPGNGPPSQVVKEPRGRTGAHARRGSIARERMSSSILHGRASHLRREKRNICSADRIGRAQRGVVRQDFRAEVLREKRPKTQRARCLNGLCKKPNVSLTQCSPESFRKCGVRRPRRSRRARCWA
jgi:hypothetical protein